VAQAHPTDAPPLVVFTEDTDRASGRTRAHRFLPKGFRHWNRAGAAG